MFKKEWSNSGLLIGILVGIPLLAFLGVQAYQTMNKKLPVIDPDKQDQEVHTIPQFSFVNQNGDSVTLDDLKGKVYVANFFFTSCPSTCPPMMKQLKRVQKQFKGNANFRIISHTVDPKRDTVATLRTYADNHGVKDGFWHLVTGKKKPLYLMARNGYDVASLEGQDGSPAGFVHSSKVILIDRNQRIRGYYDGTKESQVDELIKDIKFLLEQNT